MELNNSSRVCVIVLSETIHFTTATTTTHHSGAESRSLARGTMDVDDASWWIGIVSWVYVFSLPFNLLLGWVFRARTMLMFQGNSALFKFSISFLFRSLKYSVKGNLSSCFLLLQEKGK